jgi:hypothetical protein
MNLNIFNKEEKQPEDNFMYTEEQLMARLKFFHWYLFSTYIVWYCIRCVILTNLCYTTTQCYFTNRPKIL